MIRIANALAFSVLLAALSGCAAAGGETARISDTVTYRQRIALLPGAQVTVQLADISLADAQAVVLGSTTFTTESQVPLPFTVEYDPADIQANHTYALQAEIRDNEGKVLFRNTTALLVLTNGNPSDDVEIMLEMVSGQ
ncbi:MAG: YbaY family lipoprotein [Anaerolineales bacterium]|nr:YbaY family lipoprotein [Anaerolineales bacterium]MCL4258823.1 YbaY family lipoprotein [Anaerolineales bacterium]